MGQEESQEQLRKRVERLVEEVENLRRSERRYHSLFQENPDVIFVEDLEGNMVFANGAALRGTGYTEKEIEGLTMFQLFSPEDTNRLSRQIDEVVKGGEGQPTEHELVRKDGRRLRVEVGLSVVWEGSKPVAIQAIARDISFRKSSEDALKSSRENLERVLNAISDAVLVEDANHVVQFINNAGRSIFGAVKGKTCYTVFGMDQVSPSCAVGEIVENRRSLYQTAHRQDDKVWSITGVPLLNSDGSISVLEIIKDITGIGEVDRKPSASERLAVLAKIAREMAHEVKNPLSAITTFAQLLPEKYDDEEFRRVFTKTALEAVGKINYLLEEMVNFARPTKPVLEETDIRGVIDQALLAVHQRMAEKTIGIRRDLPPEPLLVPMDPEQMKRVMDELLSNSVDAIEQVGNIEVTARLVGEGGEHGRRQVEIVVSDDGRGIPRENLARIFEPFFTTSSENLGLGLAIAHRIISEHGGTIEAETQPGKGATFTVKLIAGRDDQAARSSDDK
jgi:PAS domain S-box-containing protein